MEDTVHGLVTGSPGDHLPYIDPLETYATEHPVGAAIIIVSALVVLVLAYFALRVAFRTGGRLLRAAAAGARKLTKGRPTEDVLTLVAASIATGVSAQGMWRFSGDVLGLDGPLRVLLFAFVEVAIVTSAVRARRNMREKYSAGIDGLAVWAFTCLTAVLSSLDARSLAEAIFRLAAPLVAAWLWERGMAVERVRLTGRSRIKWRLTPERVAVWLGAAEAKDRTTSEVDAHRRLTRVALAAKAVHQLRETGASQRKLMAALKRRDRALDQAVAHTDLATNPVAQTALLNLVTTLGGGDSITDLLDASSAPWTRLDHPAVTGASHDSEAVRLAGALNEWTEALANHQEGDREVSAAVTSMAAYIAGRHLTGTSADTSTATWPGVAAAVSDAVAEQASISASSNRVHGITDTASDTSAATPDTVAPHVAAQVTEEDMADAEVDAIIAALRDTETDTGSDTETATASATEAMRRHWDAAVAAGRVPSGAELARVGGCVESYGRRMRNAWLDEMDGRTRRRLLNAKKASA